MMMMELNLSCSEGAFKVIKECDFNLLTGVFLHATTVVYVSAHHHRDADEASSKSMLVIKA
jgi:hypothetical protein